jgi:hypothetical protein
VKVFYRQAAKDDVVRQFRHYLVTLDLPDIAGRFRDAIESSVALLRRQPLAGWPSLSIAKSTTSRPAHVARHGVWGFQDLLHRGKQFDPDHPNPAREAGRKTHPGTLTILPPDVQKISFSPN